MTVSILVVDDEPDVADLFPATLSPKACKSTYVTHFVPSGEQALDLLSAGIEPQLIVTFSNINVPGMDGLTLLSEIRQQFSDLPVMMVTAYSDYERRRCAGERGAHHQAGGFRAA